MTPQTVATIQPVRSGHQYPRFRHLLLVAALAVLSVLVPVPRSALAADFSSLQWANQTIRLHQAWQYVPNRGAGTRVCAIDTGVMLDHPDLKDAIIGGINTADATAPASFGDDVGHGTFTAGIMVARGTHIWGVAPGASLLVAKGLNQRGEGDASSTTAGILWCIDQGARVIDLSLSGGASPWDGLAEAIAFGCRQGVDFAVAAGNEGAPNQRLNPANVTSPCLITANASDRHDQLAHFSNHGENTRSVTAPGQVVVSDWTNGSVALGSGTSSSAAFVAGVMALLRSQGADARTAVRVILKSGRHPTHVRFVGGRNAVLGYGILDAGAACKMYHDLKAGAVGRRGLHVATSAAMGHW
jgi:subtilisin family serine protease